MKNILAIYNVFFGTRNRRATTSAVSSSGFNLLLGVVSIIWGAATSSPWLVMTGAYYLLLFASRRYAIRQYLRSRRETDIQARFMREFQVYHFTGAYIIAIGVSYLVLTIWLFFAVHHAEESVSAVTFGAIISISKIGLGIRGIYNFRKFKNPIISALKRLSMASAIVSFGLVQRTILLVNDAPNTVSNTLLLGIVVGIAFATVGIAMVRKTPAQVPWSATDNDVNVDTFE